MRSTTEAFHTVGITVVVVNIGDFETASSRDIRQVGEIEL